MLKNLASFKIEVPAPKVGVQDCQLAVSESSDDAMFLHFFVSSQLIVGRICNNFKKNRAFYDKSMKLGTWLVDSNTKQLRVSATTKMS